MAQRFELKVVSIQLTEVKDTKTGKVYKCKNIWYQRDGFKRFYVDVTLVATKQMKEKFSFPWKAKIKENGKLEGASPVGMVIEHDLAGKTSSAMPTADLFEF